MSKETVFEYKVPAMYEGAIRRWGSVKRKDRVPAPTKEDPNAVKEVEAEVGMGWKEGEDYEVSFASIEERKKGKFYHEVKIKNPKMLSIKEIRDICVYGQRDVTSRLASMKAAEERKAKETQTLNEGEAQ